MDREVPHYAVDCHLLLLHSRLPILETLPDYVIPLQLPTKFHTHIISQAKF